MIEATAADLAPTGTGTSRRPLLFLLGGMLGLLVAGALVAIIVSRQPDATYPPGSPQQSVSTYLRLLQDGKVDEAYALADIKAPPDSSSAMTREQFHQSFDSWGQQSHRVTLVRVHTSGNQASVTVEISVFSPGTLAPSDTTNEQTLTLERRHRTWLITGPPYLYP